MIRERQEGPIWSEAVLQMAPRWPWDISETVLGRRKGAPMHSKIAKTAKMAQDSQDRAPKTEPIQPKTAQDRSKANPRQPKI